MRPVPEDPNVITVNWVWHEWQVVVWEDANEVFPWCLRWTSELSGWLHEETFAYASDALIRAGVIAHAVEHDQRLIHPDLGGAVDRAAFDILINQLLGYATADRSSTALPHHVRR